MLGDRSIIEIHDEAGQQWVTIRNSWREHYSPAELELAILELATRHLELPSLTQVPVKDLDALTYEQMIEFGQLRRELQRLRRAQLDHLHHQVQQESRTRIRGAEASWRSGTLAAIDLDAEWLENATAQELCDTLTELLNSGPDVEHWKEPAAMTRALERIEEFWRTA